jgi:hypothetical protein
MKTEHKTGAILSVGSGKGGVGKTRDSHTRPAGPDEHAC